MLSSDKKILVYMGLIIYDVYKKIAYFFTLPKPYYSQ